MSDKNEDVGVIHVPLNEIAKEAEDKEEFKEKAQEELESKLGLLGTENWRDAFSQD